MKYYGNINANNGTCYNKDVDLGSNKSKAAKAIRDMAANEAFDGSTARWFLYDETQEEPIMSGTVRKRNFKLSYSVDVWFKNRNTQDYDTTRKIWRG